MVALFGGELAHATPLLAPSPGRRAQLGQWTWTGGEYAASGDKGIKTSEDARFYSLTAPFDAEFDNKGKDLVVSYTVKHEQNIDCGGAYIKARRAR